MSETRLAPVFTSHSQSMACLGQGRQLSQEGLRERIMGIGPLLATFMQLAEVSMVHYDSHPGSEAGASFSCFSLAPLGERLQYFWSLQSTAGAPSLQGSLLNAHEDNCGQNGFVLRFGLLRRRAVKTLLETGQPLSHSLPICLFLFSFYPRSPIFQWNTGYGVQNGWCPSPEGRGPQPVIVSSFRNEYFDHGDRSLQIPGALAQWITI